MLAIPIAAAAAFAALAVVGHSRSAQAIGPRDRRFTNARTGISVEAPAGWSLSQHTGYTDTIVLLVHPDGSRISVTASKTTAGDAAALFEANRPGLVASGLSPSRQGPGARQSWTVDLAPASAGHAGKDKRLRQLYLVRPVPNGRQAIVLTLVGRSDSFDARAAALDFVLGRLGLDDPVEPEPPARPGGAATGGDSGQRK